MWMEFVLRSYRRGHNTQAHTRAVPDKARSGGTHTPTTLFLSLRVFFSLSVLPLHVMTRFWHTPFAQVPATTAKQPGGRGASQRDSPSQNVPEEALKGGGKLPSQSHFTIKKRKTKN
ncbi:unnamed protein product, partial [Ixodes pacificus]